MNCLYTNRYSNVDRLLAIWQDLFSKQTQKWLDTRGKDDGPDVKLSPFTADEQGNLYTSITCSHKQKQFGYTYPELKTWLFAKDGHFDQEAYLSSIRANIERL